MAPTDTTVEIKPDATPAKRVTTPEPEYRLTFFDTPSVPVSLFREILAYWREPKITVPQEYYRGEAALPATDMPDWYRDLPKQLKYAFQRPRDPIGAFNYAQEKKRALLGLVVAVLAAAGGWFAFRERGVILGLIAGYILGYLGATLHGLYAGTDAVLPTMQLVYQGTGLTVLFLTVFWLVLVALRKRTAQRPAPDPGKRRNSQAGMRSSLVK
jgi:hypothetical protein